MAGYIYKDVARVDQVNHRSGAASKSLGVLKKIDWKF